MPGSNKQVKKENLAFVGGLHLEEPWGKALIATMG